MIDLCICTIHSNYSEGGGQSVKDELFLSVREYVQYSREGLL